MNKELFSFIYPPSIIILLFIIINVIVSMCNLPGYGAWTGIRPLEEKIHKLEEFAKNGQVDAIVLGSSIADFGFSAEEFSKQMSAQRAHPYRAFNFSTGGAELVTLLKLYKIVRTIVKPHDLYVVLPIQFKRSNEISRNSPDYLISNSPIGKSLEYDFALKLSKLLWHLPLIESSGALRDKVFYGRYKNLLGEGMDTYEVTSYGDRLAYGGVTKDLNRLAYFRNLYRKNISPLTDIESIPKGIALQYYFPDIDIDAMKELKTLAFKDGVHIYLLAHSSAGTLFQKPVLDVDYKLARDQYFQLMSEFLGATLVDILDGFYVPDYGVMEDTHLNSLGARIYTHSIIEALFDLHNKQDIADSVSSSLIKASDSSFNSWSAFIMRDKGSNEKKLSCRFVSSIAVPKFPVSDLYLALKLPDGEDLITTADKIGKNEYEGFFEGIRKYDNAQIFALRLLYGVPPSLRAIPSPLAKCSWF